MNDTSNNIHFPSPMPDEVWKIKNIIGERFEFDLIFDICNALGLDDDRDIFWSVRQKVFLAIKNNGYEF